MIEYLKQKKKKDFNISYKIRRKKFQFIIYVKYHVMFHVYQMVLLNDQYLYENFYIPDCISFETIQEI